MIPKDKVHKFSGPPGTGKSTTLLNVVDTLLASGVEPEHIAFTTFTRSGAYEARDRACARFGLPAGRLPYFRTLHSLCYQLLPQTEVMQRADWGVIAATLGIFFSCRVVNDDGIVQQGTTKGDYLLSLWSLSRVTQTPPETTYQLRDLTNPFSLLAWEEFQHFIQTVEAYKREFGKIDFTEMLERWLQEGQDLQCRYVIVDEAQDLSALQWAVVGKLCKNAEQVWVAGDDDQCIHEWNGASPRHFIQLDAGRYQVLPQSHRIPASVHRLAQRIIGQVSERLPKHYYPRQQEGTVTRVSGLDQIDMGKGSWLLLARNLYLLEEYANHCRRHGLLFTGDAQAVDAKIVRAVHAWTALTEGKKITAAEAVEMYAYMAQRDRVVRGFKTRLKAIRPDRMVSHAELLQEFGLVTEATKNWTFALNMIPPDQMHYLKAVQKHGGLDASPRIRISTIHGAKGQEADHVVMRPDMAFRTFEAFQANPDPEHRVFYVGVTRARSSLYLLGAQDNRAYTI